MNLCIKKARILSTLLKKSLTNDQRSHLFAVSLLARRWGKAPLCARWMNKNTSWSAQDCQTRRLHVSFLVLGDTMRDIREDLIIVLQDGAGK